MKMFIKCPREDETEGSAGSKGCFYVNKSHKSTEEKIIKYPRDANDGSAGSKGEFIFDGLKKELSGSIYYEDEKLENDGSACEEGQSQRDNEIKKQITDLKKKQKFCSDRLEYESIQMQIEQLLLKLQ